MRQSEIRTKALQLWEVSLFFSAIVLIFFDYDY